MITPAPRTLAGQLWQLVLEASQAAVAIHYAAPWMSGTGAPHGR